MHIDSLYSALALQDLAVIQCHSPLIIIRVGLSANVFVRCM